MDSDDTARPPRADDLLARAMSVDLDPLSVSELETRIAMLQSEIVRTRTRLDHASRHRSIADELFKQ